MIVVPLNGFCGDRRNHLDVTEVVDQAIEDLDLQPFAIMRGRGGAGYAEFRRLVGHLKWLGRDHRALVMIGKGYGGHWVVQALRCLAKEGVLSKYAGVGVLTIDPTWALHPLEEQIVEAPKVDRLINLWQHGPHSGYQLGCPAVNRRIDATHADIETHPRVKEEVENLLTWGDSFGPDPHPPWTLPVEGI